MVCSNSVQIILKLVVYISKGLILSSFISSYKKPNIIMFSIAKLKHESLMLTNFYHGDIYLDSIVAIVSE